MEHGESDVERQISIQGIHLSVLWNYFWKREGSFKSDTLFYDKCHVPFYHWCNIFTICAVIFQ